MKLSDKQLILLAEAAKRNDGILVIPDTLKGGAANKIVSPLLKAKLIEEIPATGQLPVWRRDEESGAIFALRINDAGLNAIGAGEVDGETTLSSTYASAALAKPLAVKSDTTRKRPGQPVAAASKDRQNKRKPSKATATARKPPAANKNAAGPRRHRRG